MPGGVEIDVFAALARTIGDINNPSWESLEGLLLVLFPHKLELQGGGKNVGICNLYFLGGSFRMAAKLFL